jgi:hypothetical protein
MSRQAFNLASGQFVLQHRNATLGWRSAFVIAGILGATGALIARAALPRGDSGGEEEPQPLLDFRPGACEPGCPRPDRRQCRRHLGLRRIAAVDCRLSHLLRRQSGRRGNGRGAGFAQAFRQTSRSVATARPRCSTGTGRPYARPSTSRCRRGCGKRTEMLMSRRTTWQISLPPASASTSG